MAHGGVGTEVALYPRVLRFVIPHLFMCNVCDKFSNTTLVNNPKGEEPGMLGLATHIAHGQAVSNDGYYRSALINAAA